MLIDIDCMDQLMKIDSCDFSFQNQMIFIDFISFINKQNTFKNAYMFWEYIFHILGIKFHMK